MAQEVLSQGAADDLVAKLLAEQQEIKESKEKGIAIEKPKINYTALQCMHCGKKIKMPYEKEKEKITSYMALPKLWRGNPCIEDTGHAFILQSVLDERRSKNSKRK